MLLDITAGTCTTIDEASSCGANCATCFRYPSATNDTCVLCNTGFTMIQGLCVQCPLGCDGCLISEGTTMPICPSCIAGYYKNETTDMCEKCGTNCYLCVDSQYCAVCRPGYSLTDDSTCQMVCDLPCASCVDGSPNVCTSCVAGYFFNSASVTNCVSVLTCNSTSDCQVCPRGNILTLVNQTQQLCVACDSASNCARCMASSLSTCISCYKGFYLSGTTCVACPSNCDFCRDNTTCYACGSGFGPVLSGYQLIGGTDFPLPRTFVFPEVEYDLKFVTCMACQAPCATCYLYDFCLSCMTGYTLMGSKCVNNNGFMLSISFSTTPSAFAANYYSLISDIANAISQSQTTVTVTDLTY